MVALFVDDDKQIEWYGLPPETHIARSLKYAVDMWMSNNYDTLYLDHDLGLGYKISGQHLRDGSMFLSYICGAGKPPKQVYCISLNPAGIKRIYWAAADFNIPCIQGTETDLMLL